MRPTIWSSGIVAPQTFSPRTAMPATGITESEARDIAAYLYAQ
ncbi:cytochrome c1 [Bradyrhizobium sp. i1.3.6]